MENVIFTRSKTKACGYTIDPPTHVAYLATCPGVSEWIRAEALAPSYGPEEGAPVIVMSHIGTAFALIGADLGFVPINIDGTWDDDAWSFVDCRMGSRHATVDPSVTTAESLPYKR